MWLECLKSKYHIKYQTYHHTFLSVTVTLVYLCQNTFQYDCTKMHNDTNIQWALLYMNEVYSAVSRYNMTLKTLVSVHTFTVCSISIYYQSWNYHSNHKTIRALH